MQQSLTSREFAEWMAYDMIEPFGAERDNLHAGIITANLVNVWAGGKHTPAEYMPFLAGDREQTPEEAEVKLRTMLKLMTKPLKQRN